MTRTIHVMLLSLLSAGVLTFCAPHPAHAQPTNSATGQYINCAQVAADVSLMAQALKIGGFRGPSADTSFAADWYTRVVAEHAKKALRAPNPAQYVRDLHKACLLETA